MQKAWLIRNLKPSVTSSRALVLKYHVVIGRPHRALNDRQAAGLFPSLCAPTESDRAVVTMTAQTMFK